MRYLRTYESTIYGYDDIMYRLHELFYEVSDMGPHITVLKSNNKVDWGKYRNSIRWVDTDGLRFDFTKCEPGYNVVIYTKKEKDIKWSDIKDTLSFTERYAKGELGLEINHINILSLRKLFKTIEDVPINFQIYNSNIGIAFRRIEEYHLLKGMGYIQ